MDLSSRLSVAIVHPVQASLAAFLLAFRGYWRSCSYSPGECLSGGVGV